MDKNFNSIASVLKLHQVLFDNISFIRNGFEKQAGENEGILGLGVKMNKQDQLHRVAVSIKYEMPGEYNIEIQMSGFFEIAESDPQKDILIKENAVAILFPYLRAELTLLTAQPGVTPVVIPPINIKKLLESSDNISEMPEKTKG